MTRSCLFLIPLLLLSFPANASPLRVSFLFAFEQGDQNAVSGFLQLEVPLERVANPSSLGAGPPRSIRTIAETPEGEPEPTEPPEEPVRERRPAARIPLAVHFDSAFVRAVVREAERLRGYPRARSRLDGLDTRARVAALLPELSLRAVRSTDRSLRLTPSGAERYELTQAGGDDLLFEARASWKLDRLVFADEELRVEHLRAAYADAKDKLVLTVLKHLFSFQHARAKLRSEALDAEAELTLELELFEAQAALDVLTDGFFSRILARERATPGQAPKKE